jgi:heme-degrading monooxygenase HmoA
MTTNKELPLYRSDSFEDWFHSSEFIKQHTYGTEQQLMYPTLVAWSRGYDEGFKKGEEFVKEKIFRELYGRKEMGG